MLWERYPKYHEMTTFATLDELLADHASYRRDLGIEDLPQSVPKSDPESIQDPGSDSGEDLLTEYISNGYDRFLVQLSWADLAYRYATKELIAGRASQADAANPYVEAFMSQFAGLDTDRKAYFLFPESVVSQFFVIAEVCRRAESFRPVKSLFPDEDRVHYLAVFDKEDMDSVLLMFHLLYTNSSPDLYGGYSLYDYSLPWYRDHLQEEGVVLRSPYLPDGIARYQGALPYYHNPAKTVYVRRNIRHILESGYFESELAFFLSLTRDIMPFFQWWYTDLAIYEEKDGFRTDWRLERTKIRTELTARGVIKPKWKHELTLFNEVRSLYPDTLYQYRPSWLGRQSLDLYIPSLKTAIEYQGIQHYTPVAFFGGEEALAQRRELDEQKRDLCKINAVRLIEWPYDIEPTKKNIRRAVDCLTKSCLRSCFPSDSLRDQE